MKKKYYYEELILYDKGKDGFFGTNEAMIIGPKEEVLIQLSNYYKNYDKFYNLMEKRRRVVVEE